MIDIDELINKYIYINYMQIHIDPYRSITWPKVNRLEWNRKGLCGLRAHETLVTRQVLTDFVDAYDVLREMEDEKESGVSGLSGCGPK